MATDEDVCCFCFVVSVFVAFGVRTQQLCFCVVASVFAAVASVFDAVVFARSLARSLSRCLFQLAHNNLNYLGNDLNFSPLESKMLYRTCATI